MAQFTGARARWICRNCCSMRSLASTIERRT
jgi:hypothetical protein